MKPHKHAAVIHAFADGDRVQKKINGEWVYCAFPDFDRDGEYRIEPAAPKWPQTTMTEVDLHNSRWGNGIDDISSQLRGVANAAIAHACETGQVVPAAALDKMQSQFKGTEKKLLDQIFKLTFPLMPSGVNVKFSMPTPKPIVYLKSFKQGEIVGRDMQIAINVRAACHAKLPGQVSNEDLKTLIDLAK